MKKKNAAKKVFGTLVFIRLRNKDFLVYNTQLTWDILEYRPSASPFH